MAALADAELIEVARKLAQDLDFDPQTIDVTKTVWRDAVRDMENYLETNKLQINLAFNVTFRNWAPNWLKAKFLAEVALAKFKKDESQR